ncbi:unnamed protein product [Cuscuta europaea]|uniref:Uncharacterized protein n=1 Tax=Cuscuta europaea TaxID=41803 RepID=A0A9P0ZXG1_CUSEU|nr:unnamed protein product [Cuscuta europaea]
MILLVRKQKARAKGTNESSTYSGFPVSFIPVILVDKDAQPLCDSITSLQVGNLTGFFIPLGLQSWNQILSESMDAFHEVFLRCQVVSFDVLPSWIAILSLDCAAFG